ncbi:esterase E4-like [Colias croceus]|uniref:esterase E4-like n=1 Tax=Colias crocea TaxID=72248 RepID=UPI001E27E61B|nr:esterase E4-like [Colias croceus]
MDATRVLVVIYLLCTSVMFVLCTLFTSEVKLPQGTLKGVKLGGYNAYLGIPYASVPKRFHEPGPAPTWTNTFYATDGSIKCSQTLAMLKIAVGREDCLVANIYTPNEIRPSNLLPVMVFIHGGGFYFGSNTNLLYDGKYLVKKGVIVVTINYRLGAFGFLCLNDTEVTGNMGLKDQVAALKWINQNIESFGGDPNSVTLIGESAGATSVHYLSLSESSKGLFKRIILESGSILIPISFEENPLDKAILLASRLGYNLTDQNEILKVLQYADEKDIVKASDTNKKNNNGESFIFQPCSENTEKSKNPFITISPRNLLNSFQLDPNIEVIIGFNDKEGVMFAGEFKSMDLDNLEKNLTKIIPRNLRFQNQNEITELVKGIRKLYFEDKPITRASYDGLINYFSDSIIIYPSIETTHYFLKANATVYNYIFKYDSIRNLNKFVSGLPLTPGANHADELFYIFDPIFYKFLPNLPKDEKMIDAMTSSWTNFARTGNPSTTNVNWVKSERNKLNFLSLGNEIKLTSLPFEERISFWREVYRKYAAY